MFANEYVFESNLDTVRHLYSHQKESKQKADLLASVFQPRTQTNKYHLIIIFLYRAIKLCMVGDCPTKMTVPSYRILGYTCLKKKKKLLGINISVPEPSDVYDHRFRARRLLFV